MEFYTIDANMFATYMFMNFVIVSIVSYYIGRWDERRKNNASEI